MPERLRIRCQRARADAEDEAPAERVSSIAACAAISTGWDCDRFDVRSQA